MNALCSHDELPLLAFLLRLLLRLISLRLAALQFGSQKSNKLRSKRAKNQQ